LLYLFKALALLPCFLAAVIFRRQSVKAQAGANKKYYIKEQ